MEPARFLLVLLASTALVAGGTWLANVHRRRRLRALATEWGMRYVRDDRFRLAPLAGRQLPLIGAADVTVKDVMYQTDAGQRTYLFTVEFGHGVIAAHKRRCRVARLDEPSGSAKETDCRLQLAPEKLGLMEQYRSLGH